MTKWMLLVSIAFSGIFASAQDLGLEEARAEWRAFRALPKQDQRRIHKVYTEFGKLTPTEQEETREWAKRWLELSPEEKATVRHRLQRWERMSPEEKRQLQERWQTLVDGEAKS